MMRALEAFQEAILMVDTTDPQCWTVLHVNKTFVEQTGAALQCGFLQLQPLAQMMTGAQDMHGPFGPMSEYRLLDIPTCFRRSSCIVL